MFSKFTVNPDLLKIDLSVFIFFFILTEHDCRTRRPPDPAQLHSSLSPPSGGQTTMLPHYTQCNVISLD